VRGGSEAPDPYRGVNIGKRRRREELIRQTEVACGEDVADYEGCMVRAGVRGPGF
jgi:hypothetical protein